MSQKITEMTELDPASLEDMLAVVDDPDGTPLNRKVKVQTIRDTLGLTGQPFKGALVTMTANQSIDDSAETALIFGAELYDTDVFHDNATNNSRLTVPTGVTKVRLSAGVRWASNGVGIRLVKILKNGVSFGGAAINRYLPDSTSHTALATGVLEVVAGDYFEVFVTQTSTAALNVEDGSDTTWFGIEAIETIAPSVTPRGALATLSTALLLQDFRVLTAIPFDAEDYDTDAIHDNVTNNSRLTVPAGVTKVRLTGHVLTQLATGGDWSTIIVYKNGSALNPGGVGQGTEQGALTTKRTGTFTAVISVVATDYFELMYKVEADSQITITQGTCFSMEIVEPAVVAGGAGKQTKWIPANQMTPTVSNGCAVLASVETVAGQPDQHVLGFDTTADEHAQFDIGLPKSWNLGNVTFKAFWTHQGGQTGGLDGVAWGLQGVALSDDDPFATAYGTAVVVTDDQVTADDIYMTSESGEITIAGTPAEGDLSFFRIFRDTSDAADDLNIDAQLVGIQLFYTTDKSNDD